MKTQALAILVLLSSGLTQLRLGLAIQVKERLGTALVLLALLITYVLQYQDRVGMKTLRYSLNPGSHA